MLLPNKWSVLWKDETGYHKKSFESDPPTPAVAFAKELKRRGISIVDVVSRRRAFPPPLKAKPPDRPGFLWCPYCIKWREFRELAVRDNDGIRGPELVRCVVCSLSIRDSYVRKYNPQFYRRWETEQESRRAQKAKKPVPTGRSRRRN